jgi:hypothetical protein
MPAAEAEAGAVEHRITVRLASIDLARCAGGSLSRRQTTGACCGLNRTRAGAGDFSGGGGPARQPGRHHRVLWTPVGRRPGRHVGIVGRLSAMPARETDAAVIQAAGEARGARTGR